MDRAAVTCVLGDVLQQEWVLGEPLHLHRYDVFELQPTTQTVPLSLLQKNNSRQERDV